MFEPRRNGLSIVFVALIYDAVSLTTYTSSHPEKSGIWTVEIRNSSYIRLKATLMNYDKLKLDNQLCFRLYAASRLITQAYRPHLDKLGVTYPQYLVLMVLWETDSLPVNDIAKKLALETNTVTPLIQRMEREGIVTRTKGKVDTRQTIVALTEHGHALREQSVDIPNCMLELLCNNGVQEQSITDILPLLDELIVSLKKKVE